MVDGVNGNVYVWRGGYCDVVGCADGDFLTAAALRISASWDLLVFDWGHSCWRWGFGAARKSRMVDAITLDVFFSLWHITALQDMR